MDLLVKTLTSFYTILGLEINVNIGDIIGIIITIFIVIISIITVIGKSEKLIKVEDQIKLPDEVAKPQVHEIKWTDRLKKGLSRTRNEIWGKIGNLVSSNKIDDETIEHIEELLYSADVGPKLVGELIEKIKIWSKIDGSDDFSFKEKLKDFIKEKMNPYQQNVNPKLYNFNDTENKLKTLMIVGVNGAGKTTTIGKLATKLTAQGAKVIVGACDTFRAAAVDQLQIWCERSGAQMVRAKEGSQPSGVAYETLQTAIDQNANYCILDTAGRLHTKGNLMEELKKNKKVLSKLDENAPTETLLVIDAITGQNALKQAQEFNRILGLTGLILTKCDSSSKAGSAISIVEELKVPIVYIGVGENVEDLNIFDLDEYLTALLD